MCTNTTKYVYECIRIPIVCVGTKTGEITILKSNSGGLKNNLNHPIWMFLDVLQFKIPACNFYLL